MSLTASPCLPRSRIRACRFRLAAGPPAARQARALVTSTIAFWEISADPGVAELLTSELVTNAIRADPGGTVTLGVSCRAGRLRVDVYDRSPAMPALAEAAPDAETGRGLLLVAELASDWGTYRTPGGKAVYFTLALPPVPGGGTWPLQQEEDAETGTDHAALTGGGSARR